MDPCHNIAWLGVADPVAAGTHLGGLLSTGVGHLVLRARAGASRKLRVTSSVYTASMALSFAASTAYHTAGSVDLKADLRRVDHAMIYVLIAGTFTPVVANLVRGRLRAIMLWCVWVAAALGIANKTLFFNATPEWVDTALFLMMGWSGLFAFPQAIRACGLGPALIMPLGGVLYSLGALCELYGWPVFWPRVFSFHEVFHIFVLAGAFAFYAFVLWVVLPYGHRTERLEPAASSDPLGESPPLPLTA